MDDVAWKDGRRNVCFSFTSVSTLVCLQQSSSLCVPLMIFLMNIYGHLIGSSVKNFLWDSLKAVLSVIRKPPSILSSFSQDEPISFDESSEFTFEIPSLSNF